MKYIIGVDPGAPIYFALINPRGKWVAYTTDKLVGARLSDKSRKFTNKPQMVGVLMRKWMRHFKPTDTIEMAVENVWGRPNQDCATNTKLDFSVGMAHGMAALMGWRIHTVTPSKWQRHFGLSRDNEESRMKAIDLWPHRAEWIKNKKDHNIAEAALIGRYVWEIENGIRR